MALAGTLKDFGLPDIFQLIGLQKKTGVLHLKNATESATLTFDQGNVVDAESSLQRNSDRIGIVLVNQGSITKEQLEDALKIQKQTLQRLGPVFLQESMVTVDDLRRGREAQLFQVVFRLFRWKEGSYNFEPQNTVDYERTGAAALGADFILMEGIRMVDEWPIIERKIPSMAAVFRRLVEPSQVAVKGADEELDLFGGGDKAKSNLVALSGEENTVFQAVDGKRSCQEIVDVTPLHDFAVCRALLDLMERNIVALTDAKGRTAARAASGTQSPVQYALLAVAVALAAFGVVRNWRQPFAVFGLAPLVQPMLDGLAGSVDQGRLFDLDGRVRAFRLTEGRLPANLEELTAASLATTQDVAGVRYTATANGFRLEVDSPSGLVALDRDLRGAAPPPAPPASPTPAPAGR
jgi:hypothetical protein